MILRLWQGNVLEVIPAVKKQNKVTTSVERTLDILLLFVLGVQTIS